MHPESVVASAGTARGRASRSLSGRFRRRFSKALVAVVQATFLASYVLAAPIAVAPVAAANQSADIDQCANGPTGTEPCDGANWVNGNLGASKSRYFEGDSIPYRIVLSDLTAGTHTVTIEWDTTKAGKHAIDYLTSWDRSVNAGSDPCDGVSGCSLGTFTTWPIPDDPNATVTQIPGVFTLFGGTITGVSAYTLTGSYAGDSSTKITISFTSAAGDAVLAWGGHIATRADWGLNGSAISISGSPYHTRLLDLDGSGGNQDRSLSAEAVIFPASITIIKDATPNGSTSFAYTASPSPLTAFNLVDNGTSANTRAFTGITNFTTYTITETVPAGWTQGFASPACTVTNANGGTQGTSGAQLTIDLKEGENVTCTYTNVRQPATLIVIKHVINDNGGTAAASDFTMSVTGGSPSPASFPGAESPGTSVTLDPGSYSVAETGPSGYAATLSADCSGTIAAGQTKTCTVTNDDIAPQLIVIKQVVNDNGGSAVAADFTLDSGGTNDTPDDFPGAESPGTTVTLNAGAYDVTETGPAGYSASFSADCSGSIGVGQTKTCTVTNDDQAATLIVIKHVVNDNGGTAVASDFTLDSGGNGDSPDNFPGAESPGTSVAISPGAYNVTETGPSGYTASFSADCSGTIALGQTKTCTVTNDDVAPQLIVIKHVINDNGGSAVASDFTLDSGGANDSPDNFAGAEAPGTTVTLDAGAYNVTESGPAGYSASFSADCAGTIAVGETKTCTVTNDDQAGTLIVIKHVINDNGGTALAADFTLDSGGTNDSPDDFAGAEAPGTTVILDAGAYNVTESGPSGYTASFSADCSGTIAVGQTKTCTVTNDDQAGTLIVIKHVINDNGGTAVAADFTLDSGGINDSPDDLPGAETPGTIVTLDAGSYNVTETGPSGYSASFSADCTGSIANGQTKTCTVTNNDISPQLIVIKHVINDNGGTAAAADFTLDSGGTNDSPDDFAGAESPGTLVALDAGAYFVTETGPSGYTASYSADCQGTIALGETKTCTVTNDDQAGTLIVIKHVVNDNGGTAAAADFTLDSGGTNDSPDDFAGAESPGTVVAVDAGAYNVTESGPSGYAASFSADCAGTIANGQTKTCTVTNDDIAPQLIVIKHVINDNGGSAVAADFTLDAGGINDSPDNFAGEEAPGTTVTLDAGAYDVTESGPAGYSASFSADCSGSIAVGETKTCTVTNNDQAGTLIVIKHVINDNGGTATAADFTLDSGGSNDSPDDFAGDEAGTTVTLDAGVYNVTETGPSGYSASFSADCSGSIAVGETKTCTVTNDDQAGTLIVIKHVVNDNGGTATAANFTLDSGGSGDSPDNFAGAEAPGTTVTLDAGAYNVTESGPAGYTASFSADCSGSIAIGQTKTCTVTNDDIERGSQLTPTNTSCQMFRDGTSETLSQLNYSVKSGKILQVNPGVFFYWNTVTAVAGSNTFTITQTITTGNFSTYFDIAAGSFVWTDGCAKVQNATITQSGNVTTITFTASSPGTYIIGVKYDPGSLKGATAPSPTTVHYDFSMGLPGSTSGLDLVKK